MKFKSKFEREVIENVSKKSGLEVEHVYIIYNSFIDGLLNLLKQDICEKVHIPILGKFELSIPKCRTLYKKLKKERNYRKQKVNGILDFNFNLYASVKYYINKFGYKKIEEDDE